MALEVTQRPEAELFTQEDPTSYDTPYLTSRWNAANLPMIYKISNTKFPVNSEDGIDSITSVANNAGFAEITISSASVAYEQLGFVEITGTTSYNGVFQIREKVDATTLVIDTAFVANETGSLQRYYNNYTILVRVYSGIPEYHPLNSTNPLELITDNPITIVPNAENEATIDIAPLVKSELSLDYLDEVNDTNFWTSVYIEYAEQYDTSNGSVISTFTSSYTEDVLSDCNDSVNNFINNGDFSSGFTGWTNSGSSGGTWSEQLGKAEVGVNVATRETQELRQSGLDTTIGNLYTISFDYGNPDGQTWVLTVTFGAISVYSTTLSDASGTISFNTIFAPPIDSSFTRYIAFDLFRTSDSTTVTTFTLDNISLTNADVLNPCIAYTFASHSAIQPQSKYAGNMGEYVQNFSNEFPNKFLTLFKKPVLFEGNYFELSSLIPQSVIQAAIQSGGYFIEVVEFDKNGLGFKETRYEITDNLGDGLYRFRLDDKTFDDRTKKFTVQIIKVPINQFVDADGGTFLQDPTQTEQVPPNWNFEIDEEILINGAVGSQARVRTNVYPTYSTNITGIFESNFNGINVFSNWNQNTPVSVWDNSILNTSQSPKNPEISLLPQHIVNEGIFFDSKYLATFDNNYLSATTGTIIYTVRYDQDGAGSGNSQVSRDIQAGSFNDETSLRAGLEQGNKYRIRVGNATALYDFPFSDFSKYYIIAITNTDGTMANMEVRVNGTLLQFDSFTEDLTSNIGEGLTIGTWTDGTGSPILTNGMLVGYIYNVYTYSTALSNTQIQDVTDFLNRRYNVY